MLNCAMCALIRLTGSSGCTHSREEGESAKISPANVTLWKRNTLQVHITMNDHVVLVSSCLAYHSLFSFNLLDVLFFVRCDQYYS